MKRKSSQDNEQRDATVDAHIRLRPEDVANPGKRHFERDGMFIHGAFKYITCVCSFFVFNSQLTRISCQFRPSDLQSSVFTGEAAAFELFHGHGFGDIAGFIDVMSENYCHIICQYL